MEFTLRTTTGFENFLGESRYRFTEQGLLIITTDGGTKRVYSPNAWLFLEQKEGALFPGGWAKSV